MHFSEHPQRRQIVNEMHLRRFPRLDPPAVAYQIVRLVGDAVQDEEWDALERCSGASLDRGTRHLELEWSEGCRIGWEKHSEAITTTVTGVHLATEQEPWTLPGVGPLAAAVDWMTCLPGYVVRATQIFIVTDDSGAEALAQRASFHPSDLISCLVGEKIRIWTDFRIHDEGFGRLIISANGAGDGELSRSIQRLQELGNYRNLSLLGLPVARAGWARLDVIERDLDETGRALVGTGQSDDMLLASLSSLTARLLALSSETDQRLSATSAYGKIVTERLAELHVRAIADHQSLGDFIGRRFYPAVRTCRDFQARLAQINLRAAQFTALLRARIETQIENQNARLLASVDRSARMQLRLQHLVEGLSAIAVSYYALGLASYPLKAIEKLVPTFSATLVLGAFAPLLCVGAFVAMAQARKRATTDLPSAVHPARSSD
ncbi:DUF3422 domain-containing protein [Sphingomonas sp. VNH70]|jgi:uncharacterized membrane-anchored protein|uniref:DUF3422 domain-containing protein n=1 Tax=Sphingomonas silueang TaxID=3156617 RepID=UPI0032B55BC0